MCTVIVAFKHFSRSPLIIAANRDEFFFRETDPPSIINQSPKILAPRDRLKSGTFIGINQWGLVAAITNLSGLTSKDINKKSRGYIVLRALGSPDIERLLMDLKYIDFSDYNLFQLFVADRERAILLKYTGKVTIEECPQGVITISNWDAIEDVSDYKRSLIMSHIDRLSKDAEIKTIINGLSEILKLHSGKDMRYQICVHTENYGTVSSSIIAPFQEEPIFYYSIGPLCKNRFRSYSEDLKAILKI